MNLNLLFQIFIYVASVIFANYTATWFLPVGSIGVVSVGTLIFGITVTQRDRIHFIGRKNIYLLIFFTAILNLVLSFIWQFQIRVIIASFIAIVISEITDTEVYQATIKKNWLVRIISSNAVSIPIDSTLFNLIAFYLVYSNKFIFSLIISEIIIKGIVSIIYAVMLKKYFQSLNQSGSALSKF